MPYYVVFDPLKQIQSETEMNRALLRVWANSVGRYVELTPAQGISEVEQSVWLEEVGLGLTLWEGQFEEEVTRLWLRWCDREGQVIATGAEGQEIERQRVEVERQGREVERQGREVERQGREVERQRADEAELRANRLTERLRALGINPDDI
jgi:hypothetical protein